VEAGLNTLYHLLLVYNHGHLLDYLTMHHHRDFAIEGVQGSLSELMLISIPHLVFQEMLVNLKSRVVGVVLFVSLGHAVIGAPYNRRSITQLCFFSSLSLVVGL
jgi:hypothetical protein